tara:strand:- start:581 stop:1342 length:762 start_codon:yes stop_codon:yes gene_type:complete
MLKNKKILVVGAGGLLGSNLVKALIDNQACVVAADLSKINLEAKLQNIGVNTKDENIILHELDLLSKDSISNLFSLENLITGAVNCSYPRNSNYGKHFFDVSLEDFNENISLNLGSSFVFMQECASYFNKQKKPFSLVNISSVYGVIAPKFNIYDNTKMTTPIEYSAIKSGLIHMTKYVSKYIGNSDFRVNLVSPGGILDGQPNVFIEAYKKETFGKGMLDVADVIGSILFLLSPSSKYINGQNIIVDDGFTI